MSSLVSIIVPIYNSEEYIAETIQSLLNQKYRNIEIILVDDGSVDNSLTICQLFKEKDNRIRVYHKKNEGVSVARNFGIKRSTGKYIMFVDSDDLLEKDAISDVIQLQEKHEADLILFNIRPFNDKSKIESTNNETINFTKNIQKIKSKIIPRMLLDETLNSVCNKVYLAQLIKENSVFFERDLSLGEDLLFNYKYIIKIKSFIKYEKKLYNYRKGHSTSLSTKLHPNKYNMLIYVNDSIRELSEAEENYQLLSQVLNKIRIKNIYSVIRDYIEYKTLDSINVIHTIIDKESLIIENIENDFIYGNLGNAIINRKYKLVIIYTKIIIFMRNIRIKSI